HDLSACLVEFERCGGLRVHGRDVDVVYRSTSFIVVGIARNEGYEEQKNTQSMNGSCQPTKNRFHDIRILKFKQRSSVGRWARLTGSSLEIDTNTSISFQLMYQKLKALYRKNAF